MSQETTPIRLPRYALGEKQKAMLDAHFKYHAPTEDTKPRYERINSAAEALARAILEECPDSADRSAAYRQVREAKHSANAAIACNGV